ncbi:GYD domain-containing protein [Stigmatella aurantiaca]|nr:GYD domain-containing protein [Stigmatella aurantiaca]ADO71687.1 conserved uncharacterized protein [Stigmatella aurantiaca DW4/3-1]
MPQYAILSKYKSSTDIRSLPQRAQAVKEKTLRELPHLKCTLKLAFHGGPYDALDVVETEDEREAQRAAEIISEHGDCTTELLPVTHWQDFVRTTHRITTALR